MTPELAKELSRTLEQARFVMNVQSAQGKEDTQGLKRLFALMIGVGLVVLIGGNIICKLIG